jgi:hypothetical protein
VTIDLIIRPFQSVTITPPRRIASAPTEPQEVVLLIGVEGEGKTFTGNFSSSQSFYMGQIVKETNRDTTQKRIENPDDSEQHVDVANINRLTTKSGSGQQYQKTIYAYKNKKEPGEAP